MPEGVSRIFNIGISGSHAIEGMVSENFGRVLDIAIQEMGIGINQNLGWVEAPTIFRAPGAVDAISIELAGANSGQVTVPDRTIAMGQSKAGLG